MTEANMTVTEEKKPFNIYLSVLTPISFAVSVICLFFGINEELRHFWTLPLAYTILNLVFSKNNERLSGLGYHIINIVMFLRFVVLTPMGMFTEYYDGLALSVDSYTPTLLLMIYDMVAVFAVMAWYGKRSLIYKPRCLSIPEGKKFGPIARMFFIFVAGVTFLAILQYPQIRKTLLNFSFIVNTDDEALNETLSGPVFVFFKIGINVIYALVMAWIVKHSEKRGKFALLICSIISVAFISSNWSGGGGISRWGLVTSSAVSYILLVKEFPDKKRMIITVGGVAFVMLILAASVAKLMIAHFDSSEAALGELFSVSYFNEYFQGAYPVANGLRAMEAYSDRINFITFLDDTISAYPWLNKLFYQRYNLTETMYLMFLGMEDKILPTICQGYAHFGYFLAPMFSVFLTYIALRCDTAVKHTDNIVRLVALTQIGVWCALFMAVNVFIVQRTTMYFVLLLIVLAVDRKITGGKKK